MLLAQKQAGLLRCTSTRLAGARVHVAKQAPPHTQACPPSQRCSWQGAALVRPPRQLLCRAEPPSTDKQPRTAPPPPPPQSPALGASLSSTFGKVNTAYVAIFAIYGLLLLLKWPYIFAILAIVTTLFQNSSVTSLNNLVLWFYESGLFMNFAEAVYCVRLVTWLSIGMMLISFALFS